jgi:protein tyrosine phosphatase type IVA
MTTLVSKPSLIEYGKVKFLIMDAPKPANLHLYIKECKKHNVLSITRISEPSYSKEEVETAGISLHEMFFVDGASPPPDIIDEWRSLVAFTFKDVKTSTPSSDKPCIAIHCVAGLGRAPVLVAIALIDEGLDAISAVRYIRERRRGAINAVQLSYLETCKPKKNNGGKCIII